jgi:glycosyltransferase involved in cell wall biosynthesis
MPSATRPNSVVTIVRQFAEGYRVPFYEALRAELGRCGVTLQVIYGEADVEEVRRGLGGDIAWGRRIRNRWITVGPLKLRWQPCSGFLHDSDLIIVEQASKLPLNYLLLARQAFGGAKVAFWGHGRNFQEHMANRLGEAVKRLISRWSHWWFAYTELSAAAVQSLPYPSDRITVVQNAIDTAALSDRKLRTTEAELSELRRHWSIESTNVAVYAGSLYAEKRICFLLEAAVALRRRLPDFELIVIGAGPDQALVEEATRQNSWIHYVGPRFGAEKVPYFSLARAMLLPGAVGLAVLDSFALEVPLVTLDLADHGPELAYLRHGENGLQLPAATDAEGYAAAVSLVMAEGPLRDRLLAGCRRSAEIYTLPAMVSRFAQGVLQALGASPPWKHGGEDELLVPASSLFEAAESMAMDRAAQRHVGNR